MDIFSQLCCSASRTRLQLSTILNEFKLVELGKTKVSVKFPDQAHVKVGGHDV